MAHAPAPERAIHARLRALRGPTPAGAALVGRLVESFLARAPAYLADLDQAVRHGDARSVVRHAHALGGMAGNLGAAPLAEICERLELAPAELFDDLMVELRAAFAGVRPVFREIIGFADDSYPDGNPAGP